MNIKIKLSLKITILYLLFGFLWIFFFDKVIFFITSYLNIPFPHKTYKVLYLILLTGILLFKMIEVYLKKEQDDNKIITEKNLRLDRINNNMNDLFNLSLKMLSPIEYADEYFVKEIFRIASTISEENDLGSAYIVNDGKIKYIDSIGFDLDELNKMNIDIDHYKVSSKKIIVNKDPIFREIKESIYVGISKEKKIIGGFNLDISTGSDKNYSEDIINRVQVIQNLSNGFYKIKKYDDYKTMLQDDIVRSFITALEFHDDYTKGHSELVAMFSTRIGESLGLDKNQLEDLYWAAVMHDIGKIIIPSNILNKTGKLTDSEFDLIKKHPMIGYEIISKSETLHNIAEYILFHHERWDGKGYPNKLKGDEIPLLSQIICIADSWHAMTSERPYKNKLNEEEGVIELIKNKGTQFSPKIVDIFIDEKLYLIDKK